MKILVLFLGLILIGCTSRESRNAENNALSFATEKDSLDLLSELIEDMKEENYENLLLYNGDMGCGRLPIEIRNQFTIEQNKFGEVIILGWFKHSGITNEVVTYFSANREKNDVTNNYPMYSRISKKEIIYHVKQAMKEAKEVKNTPHALEDIVDFKERQVEEWMKQLRAITVLQIDKLPTPDIQSSVLIDYPQTEKNNHMIDSVLIGFYLLRDYASKKYFNESYLSLFHTNKQHQNLLDSERLKALSILHHLAILDKEGLKKRGLNYVYRNTVGYPEPPPPPPIR